MRELFDQVLELTASRNVTLQIVPLEGGLHGCLDGPLRLLEALNGKGYAYSEGQQNGRLISDPKEGGLLYRRYDTRLLERLRGEL